MGTRDQALNASVELLGTQGIRALTHGRVDAAAGLPKGSASNHFRTRADLLHAVVDHLVATEQHTFAAEGPPQNVDDLVASLSTFIREATGPQRTLTAARLALFTEAFHDPEVRAVLAAGRSQVESAAARVLETLGFPQPFATARRVLTQVDGAILHHLAFGPDAGPEEVEASLRACLT
ncbi:TetR/AcrR family transcriptional regulator [Pseudactinotalea sp. Z1748]|uniref:TetR/AcrR family transcriptional regulator n=1 Tax=Pseudactinotalea sp. Z1748 TaxID=3413027 RepID=UPI003C7A4358